MIDPDLLVLSMRVGERLCGASQRLVTAESCTGGLIASACTATVGASDWFECALVTYSAESKRSLLHVSQSVIELHGLVSEPVARDMALGAISMSPATVSVAVTGVAGPAGGDPVTPVGTVWLAWARSERGNPLIVQTSRHELVGTRTQIQHAAATLALQGLLA